MCARHAKVGLLAAAALVAVVSCSGPAQRVVGSGEFTIYVHSWSPLPRGGMAALIGGRLAVRERCVVLESPDGTSWYPVVWPSGTRIASVDPFAIRLPSGEQLAVGEDVRGGGGFLYRETLDVDIPVECLGESQEIAVFNPDENLSKP